MRRPWPDGAPRCSVGDQKVPPCSTYALLGVWQRRGDGVEPSHAHIRSDPSKLLGSADGSSCTDLENRVECTLCSTCTFSPRKRLDASRRKARRLSSTSTTTCQCAGLSPTVPPVGDLPPPPPPPPRRGAAATKIYFFTIVQ